MNSKLPLNKMNASIIKKKKKYPVNKALILIVLTAINFLLYTETQKQISQWVGTVEIPTRRWTTSTTQFTNTLFSNATYYSIKDGFNNGSSIKFRYSFERIGNNKLLFIKSMKPKSIRRNRAFYLDNECSLIFSGSNKMSMYNTSINCKK